MFIEFDIHVLPLSSFSSDSNITRTDRNEFSNSYMVSYTLRGLGFIVVHSKLCVSYTLRGVGFIVVHSKLCEMSARQCEPRL